MWPKQEGTQSVDVLAITAVEEETEALNRFGFEKQADSEGVHYVAEFDIEGKGSLEVIHCSLGGMGSAAAASVTAASIRRFRPNYVVLLGICAGIGKDAGIGDIIVPSEVLYYSHIKATEKGPKNRPSGALSDMKLISYLGSLSIDPILDSMPDLSAHAKQLNHSPKVLSGKMLSGEELVNSRHRVDRLLSVASDAKGLDMESWGVYFAAKSERIPVIAIKAVSDFADGTKSDDHKAYAARLAATFFVSFLKNHGHLLIRRAKPSSLQRSSSTPKLGVAHIPTNSEPEHAIYNGVNAAIVDPLFSTWNETLELLLDRLKDGIAQMQGKPKRRKESSKPSATITEWVSREETLFRDAYFKMLDSSFSKNDLIEARVTLEGIQLAMQSIASLEEESVYSNWLADLRAFFWDRLQPTLHDMAKPRYDRNLYWFLNAFCETINEAMLLSVKTAVADEIDFFSFDFGLSLVYDMIEDGLDRQRELHTSEDDFSYTPAFSVIVEPLMRGLSECISAFGKELSEPQSKALSFYFVRMRQLCFHLLERYRNQDMLRHISRSGVDRLMKHHLFLDSNIGRSWKSLFDYEEPRGFDPVIEALSKNLSENSGRIPDYAIVDLFEASLESIAVQASTYKKAAGWLKDLCVQCIHSIQNADTRTELIDEMVEHLLWKKESKEPYLDVSYALCIIGSEIRTRDDDVALSSRLLEIWRENAEQQEAILQSLREIAEMEVIQGPIQYYPKKWQKEGAEEVMKRI